MKKILFSVAAVAMLLASCQEDAFEGSSVTDEVVVSLNASTPEIMQKGATYTSSAKGGLSNVDLVNTYDVRYILEIYNAETGNLVKTRAIQGCDGNEAAKFETRLSPNRTYKFVVWADFVNQGDTTDLHYNTQAGLKAGVTVNGDWAINDESRDAYFVAEDILITNNAQVNLTLRRPFGKVRVVATDVAELELGTTPVKVNVTYEAANVAAFNPYTGEISATTAVVAKEYTDVDVNNYGETDGTQTLFTDYILATDVQSPVHFELTAIDNAGKEIATYNFNTDIPVQLNYLTTIKGNILTTATNVEISIDEAFANADTENPIEIWDGKTTKQPALVDGYYMVGSAAELAYFAGKGVDNIKLTSDIDLAGHSIKSIGVKGIFDGQNHTIANGSILPGSSDYSRGLFWGEVYQADVIKNVSFKNLESESTGYVGIVYGDIQNGATVLLENLHIYNSSLKGINSVGPFVGMIASGVEVTIKDCSVNDTEISNTALKGESGFVCGFVGRVNPDAIVNFEGNNVSNNVVINAYYSVSRGAETIDAVAAKRSETSVINGKESVTINGGSITRNTFFEGEEGEPIIAETIEVVDGVATVATPGQFVNMASVPEGAKIELSGDIDFGGAEVKWITLDGNTFDGKGHTLKNMTITTSDDYSCGLFNYLSTGDVVISNITIENPIINNVTDVVGGHGFAGVIFGSVENMTSVTIDNVHIKGADVKGISNVGGFVGYSTKPVTIKNSSISDSKVGNIKVANESGNVAGLVGRMNGNAAQLTIENVEMTNVAVEGYWAAKRSEECIAEEVGDLIYGATVTGTATKTNVTVKAIACE